jgi:hypothetical protein
LKLTENENSIQALFVQQERKRQEVEAQRIFVENDKLLASAKLVLTDASDRLA